MSTANELGDLVNDELNKPVRRNGQDLRDAKNKETIAAKIAAGTFVSGNLKYTEERLINFLDGMFQWITSHPTVCFMEEYYLAEDTDKSIPFGSLKKTYGRHETCDEIREAIKKVLEIRLAKAALNGTHKENFTKFLLMNNFGYKEKTEQDITLSTKEVKFKFGNKELQQPEKEEDNE